MKFDDSQVGWVSNTIYFEGDELIKSNKLKPCSICNELCAWVSVTFKAYYCSEECNRCEWDDFWEGIEYE